MYHKFYRFHTLSDDFIIRSIAIMIEESMKYWLQGEIDIYIYIYMICNGMYKQNVNGYGKFYARM